MLSASAEREQKQLLTATAQMEAAYTAAVLSLQETEAARPTSTPTITPTPTKTSTPTYTPTETIYSSPTYTATATATRTPRPSATHTRMPTATTGPFIQSGMGSGGSSSGGNSSGSGGGGSSCDPHYPTVCIPPYPPDLDCKDVPYRRFTVIQPDPHRFDGDFDGVGCESN